MIHRLLVGNITHLTDARYYAARGVYALAYKYDQPDSTRLGEIKEMMDWVEGPKRFLDLRDYRQEPYPALSEYDGFIGDADIGDEDFEKVRVATTRGTRILLKEQLPEDLSQISERAYCQLRDDTIDRLIQAAEENENIYFYLDGGEEEQVGLKDYDDLNDLLDKLQWQE